MDLSSIYIILINFFILFSLFSLFLYRNLFIYENSNKLIFKDEKKDIKQKDLDVIIKSNFIIEFLSFVFLFFCFFVLFYLQKYKMLIYINLFIYFSLKPFLISFFNKNLNIFLKTNFIYLFYEKVFYPFYFIFNLIYSLLNNKYDDKLKESVLNLEAEQQSWQESQEEMISNIFDFADIVALEAMTHRTDITALDEDKLNIENIVSLAVDTGYSRIPIYKENLDNVIGIIYVKDLLKFLQMDPTKFSLKDIIRTPLFIPQTLSCNKIFEEFTKNRVQMAIVLDEYGGTSGIITMEDILEFIVGNIEDEYDNESSECEQISQDEYIIDGSYSIKELVKDFDLDINEQFEDYNYTLAGYILDKVKTIPNQNDFIEIKFDGFSFTVLEVDSNRITKVKLLFFRRDNYENT